MGAQIPRFVSLGLEEQSVIIDVAQAEGIAVGLDGEELREVTDWVGSSLVEESLVAVLHTLIQTDEQVCLVGG